MPKCPEADRAERYETRVSRPKDAVAKPRTGKQVASVQGGYRVRHPIRTKMWLFVCVVLTTSAAAQAETRVESKPYDGMALNDCGAAVGMNRTEICFAVGSLDETLELIIHDASGLSVAAAVYFEDDRNKLIESDGRTRHIMCGSGGPIGEPRFSIPPLAKKVTINLGFDGYFYDPSPMVDCNRVGRRAIAGSYGTIDAKFETGS